MYEDKYIELKRLKKNNTIGILLIIFLLAFIFLAPAILPYFIPNIIDYIENTPYIIISVIIGIFLSITIYMKLNSPYYKLKNELTFEIKNNYLKTELNNTFNNSYKEENIEELKKELIENNIGYGESIIVNDCFSAKYNNIRFKYLDAEFYHHSDDSTIITFNGPIYIFETKNSLEGDLYIGHKTKSLFGSHSEIDSIIDKKNNQEDKPTTSVLDTNIMVRSNSKPSIIEDSSFQQIINELMLDNKYMFIYKNNKLYVLNYNYEDLFEIIINNRVDELKAKDHIQNNIKTIQSELENITRYRERLNIKEDTF